MPLKVLGLRRAPSAHRGASPAACVIAASCPRRQPPPDLSSRAARAHGPVLSEPAGDVSRLPRHWPTRCQGASGRLRPPELGVRTARFSSSSSWLVSRNQPQRPEQEEKPKVPARFPQVGLLSALLMVCLGGPAPPSADCCMTCGLWATLSVGGEV